MIAIAKMNQKGSLVNLLSIIGMILAFFVFYAILLGGSGAIERSANSNSEQVEMELMLNPILSTSLKNFLKDDLSEDANKEINKINGINYANRDDLNEILKNNLNVADLIRIWWADSKSSVNSIYDDLLRDVLEGILRMSEERYEFFGKKTVICTTAYAIAITENIPDHVFYPEGVIFESPYWSNGDACPITEKTSFRSYRKVGDVYVYLFKEVKVK